MDKKSLMGDVEFHIENLITSLLPHGAGGITDFRLRSAMLEVANKAFEAGKTYALFNLLTADQAAAEIGVSPRRMRAIIKARHERFGVGMQFGKSWLIHRDELESLKPGEQGYPKGKPRTSEGRNYAKR